MRELSSAARRRMAFTLKSDMLGAMVVVVCAQLVGVVWYCCVFCV
jgi:hypothetical protein